jgi:hypothetical protein
MRKVKSISLSKIFKDASKYMVTEEDIINDRDYDIDDIRKCYYTCNAIEKAISESDSIDVGIKLELLEFIYKYLNKCGLNPEGVGFPFYEYGKRKAQKMREIWLDFLTHSARSSDVRFKFKGKELFEDSLC